MMNARYQRFALADQGRRRHKAAIATPQVWLNNEDVIMASGAGRKSKAGVNALLMALAALATTLPGTAIAQQAAPQPSAVPIPGELELAKMIWSTMVAVDQANRAGNYSVLRDLSAPGFQAANDGAKLTEIFASLRAGGVDLTNTLLIPPTYRAKPAIIQQGVLRTQGVFAMRPTAIEFDLYFQWVSNQWRLFGVSVSPYQLVPPAPLPAAAPAKPAPGRK